MIEIRDPEVRAEARIATEDRLRDAVLDALLAAGRPLTVGEVAEAVGLHPDAARRILRALEAEGRARPSARVLPGLATDELWAPTPIPVPTMKEADR